MLKQEELSVDVTVNDDCSKAKYPVLVTFGTISGGNCTGQRNATEVLLSSEGTDARLSPEETEFYLSPGQTATFFVNRFTSPGSDVEYCYIVSLDGIPGKY